jgi:hypothetical protein
MESSDVLGALRRRAYLIPVGILLTLGLGFAAAHLVPVKYEAKANVLLLPPGAVGEIGGNPYLALGGLDPAAAVLGRAMIDGREIEKLKSMGANGAFTVDKDLTTSGPVLLVDVIDTSPGGALKTLDLVTSQMPKIMSELQLSIKAPTRSFITTSVINEDRKATKVPKAQIRAVLVALAAGFAMSLFGTALLDGFLLRRSGIRPEPAANVVAIVAPKASEAFVRLGELDRPPAVLPDPPAQQAVMPQPAPMPNAWRLRLTPNGSNDED